MSEKVANVDATATNNAANITPESTSNYEKNSKNSKINNSADMKKNFNGNEEISDNLSNNNNNNNANDGKNGRVRENYNTKEVNSNRFSNTNGKDLPSGASGGGGANKESKIRNGPVNGSTHDDGDKEEFRSNNKPNSKNDRNIPEELEEEEEEEVQEDSVKNSSNTAATTSEANPKSAESSSSSSSSSSSPPSSPVCVSPQHTLRRSKSSNFRLIDRKSSVCSQISIIEKDDRLADIIGWYPAFLLRAMYDLTVSLLYITVTKLPFAIPTLWLSGSLWLFLKFAQIPLSLAKSVLTVLFVPPIERYRKKRTVLISGGSSVQSVHLARNFHSAGARVVVCEVDGHFGLANFSTAVSKYYTIPEPNEDYMDPYINALKEIVAKEKVSYYIPVSELYPAYFDALAKPHLEALNCQCFVPDVKDVSLLDDTLEFMRKLRAFGSTTAPNHLVQNKRDLDTLYDAGIPRSGDHFMVTVGPASVRKKRKIDLTSSRRDLKIPYIVSDQHPWLVVQDYRGGQHYITCTTVRESRVVANVTCRQDSSGHGLVPIEHREIEIWMQNFFSNLAANRRVTGHMSFLFAVSSDSGTILPLDCQVGVRLPYMCYTSVHPRIVWKPCRHFSRSTSGPIVTDTGRYWVHEIFLKTLRHPSIEAIVKLAGIMFDRKEALFVFWDPLPYCAFYYLQLPLNSISSKLTNRSKYYL